jgi:hypothetical protein
MLRLIVTLAVCITLVHCANNGDSDMQSLHGEGKDNQDGSVNEEEQDLVTSCIVCNSNEVDFCDDETFSLENEGTKANLSENCFDYHNSEDRKDGHIKPPANAKYYCTKTKITFEYGNTVEKTRIVRACSYAPGRYGWAGCYYTANNLYSTTVCKCENTEKDPITGELKQNCNSATSIVSSLFLILPALLMLR